MTDGQFWFVMIALLTVLDLFNWRAQRKERADYLAMCDAYDKASEHRHREWMTHDKERG